MGKANKVWYHIRGNLQETLTAAETNVQRVALGAEQLMESGASRETLAEYFDGQREKLLADESFMNTYIAGRDWHIVPGFDAPESFHASERIWYLGAADMAGKVYISEPYLDADTGAMCFTVSTLLSDGETVVGMDLTLSKVQESILQMTRGNNRSAMIVTAGGLIVGYTDMSLVGERADEKLPEYADILRRVAASQEHGSFLVRLIEFLTCQRDTFTCFFEYCLIFFLRCLCNILSSREKAVAVIPLLAAVAYKRCFEQFRAALCRLGETAVMSFGMKFDFLGYRRGILGNSFAYCLERHPLA